MSPVIVATLPVLATLSVTPLSKFCSELRTKFPPVLLTALLLTVGFAKFAFIPIPLIVLVPGIIPSIDATGTVLLLTTAAVVVVVIGLRAIFKLVISTLWPVDLFIFFT